MQDLVQDPDRWVIFQNHEKGNTPAGLLATPRTRRSLDVPVLADIDDDRGVTGEQS